MLHMLDFKGFLDATINVQTSLSDGKEVLVVDIFLKDFKGNICGFEKFEIPPDDDEFFLTCHMALTGLNNFSGKAFISSGSSFLSGNYGQVYEYLGYSFYFCPEE